MEEYYCENCDEYYTKNECMVYKEKIMNEAGDRLEYCDVNVICPCCGGNYLERSMCNESIEY